MKFFISPCMLSTFFHYNLYIFNHDVKDLLVGGSYLWVIWHLLLWIALFVDGGRLLLCLCIVCISIKCLTPTPGYPDQGAECWCCTLAPLFHSVTGVGSWESLCQGVDGIWGLLSSQSPSILPAPPYPWAGVARGFAQNSGSSPLAEPGVSLHVTPTPKLRPQ